MYEIIPSIVPSDRYQMALNVAIRLISTDHSDEELMKEPIEKLAEFLYNHTSSKFVNNIGGNIK